MSTSRRYRSAGESPGGGLAPLLTMREVAAILGISVSKAYTLVSSGAIASIVIGERSRRVEPGRSSSTWPPVRPPPGAHRQELGSRRHD